MQPWSTSGTTHRMAGELAIQLSLCNQIKILAKLITTVITADTQCRTLLAVALMIATVLNDDDGYIPDSSYCLVQLTS